MTILTGEIGAETKLILCSHRFDEEKRKMIIDRIVAESEIFPTSNYVIQGENGNTLDSKRMIEDFLRQYYYGKESEYSDDPQEQKILGACFGVTALVKKGEGGEETATITREALNLKVNLSKFSIQKSLPHDGLSVSLINDMEAISKSLYLAENEAKYTVLSEGKNNSGQKGKQAILLVSSGLGQACWTCKDEEETEIEDIIFDGSEGGHGPFAPGSKKEEYELGLYLLDIRKAKITWEYVLSAPGFVRIYDFLRQTGRYGEESQELREQLNQDPSNPQPIIDKAINNSDPLARATLKTFVSIMGNKVGELALTYKAEGGIYIGGIPLVFEQLSQDNELKKVFMEAYLDQEGDFREYNEAIPLFIYEVEGSVCKGAAWNGLDLGFVSDGILAYL